MASRAFSFFLFITYCKLGKRKPRYLRLFNSYCINILTSLETFFNCVENFTFSKPPSENSAYLLNYEFNQVCWKRFELTWRTRCAICLFANFDHLMNAWKSRTPSNQLFWPGWVVNCLLKYDIPWTVWYRIYWI